MKCQTLKIPLTSAKVFVLPFGKMGTIGLIPLPHRSPIRFNAHWIQLRSVVASPNTVTIRIDAHYFQSTYVCGLRNSVRFDSILFAYLATGHCIIQLSSVRSCPT